MSKSPALSNIRIIPRETEYLDRKLGARGEVFFDQAGNTLRLYDGQTSGGVALLKADLSNLEVQISSVILSDTPPANVESGTIWVDTSTLKLYVYYSDGSGTQWVQPTTPSYGGGSSSNYTLPTATTSVLGGVKIDGTTITLNGSSQLVANYTLPTASTSVSGGIKIDGSTLAFNGNGQLYYTGAGAGGYTLPTATTSVLGGVKVDGSTITINGSGIISSTASGGAFSGLSDASSAGLTVDKVYLPAITRLNVTNRLTAAYLFDQYTGDNPTIYAISGTTIAFNLQATGHPFLIQTPGGTNYNTGLIHVSTAGVVSTGSSAQGQTSGTLYWKVPYDISGGYRYQCSAHVGMVGSLTVKSFAGL